MNTAEDRPGTCPTGDEAPIPVSRGGLINTIIALQLPDVGGVPAQARVNVFLNPAGLRKYFIQYGTDGMATILSGIDEGLVKTWADWHGEVVDRKTVEQDENLAALKDILHTI
ncbi:hypothetical protein FN846DRAFT_902086 [Sphaerosporella brunnea]|uniref:Uncharacterized protein n=1 Tax=Sphaerosporella brunnea TaxID=1250544 RepID=A0A5J5FAV0_9PEZI|nr:hypothetical protein FN846DRAFT_902086 [Sphaerosporella brunnea]